MKLFKKKEKTEETEKKPNVLDKVIGIPKRCYRKCYFLMIRRPPRSTLVGSVRCV